MFNLSHYWYQHKLHPLLWPFIPLEWLFRGCVALRYFLYHKHFLKSYRSSVPVIVVGNLTVGGTGKTPFVIWLAQFLKKQGYLPGVVSRGYSGPRYLEPLQVTQQSSIAEASDESLLLARHAGCPVVVSFSRVRAVKWLLAHTDCNVILSEDGLQHYALDRQYEIVMVRYKEQWGNQHLLPAGPLREPLTRLKRANVVITTGNHKEAMVRYVPRQFVAMQSKKAYQLLAFPAQTIHALAGIGHPDAFFDSLRQLGFKVIPHVFPDHYHFKARDIIFDDTLPVVMTEKDSVKCEAFATAKHWYLAIELEVCEPLQTVILSRAKDLEISTRSFAECTLSKVEGPRMTERT